MTAAVILIDRLTGRKAIWCLLGLYGVVFGAILVTLEELSDVTGGYGILDFDRGYDGTRVTEVLGSYGAEGMALYARIQVLDLFNPALYALVAAVFTRLLWRRRGPDWLCLCRFWPGLATMPRMSRSSFCQTPTPTSPRGW